MFSYQGLAYPFLRLNQTGMGSNIEKPSTSYGGLAAAAYHQNGPAFTVMMVRQDVFSEATFKFRQLRDGRPGNLFGSTELQPLEQPWPGATTGDLLARCILDVDLAGNSFWARDGQRLRRLRPDWVSILVGSLDEELTVEDWRAEVVGYSYQPGGPGSGKEEQLFFRDEVAHFAPRPDPLAYYRGMSWLSPIVRELMADKGLTDHKISMIEHGGTPNMIVKPPAELNPAQFESWVKKFRETHEGIENAYKKLFLGGGADATVVGMDWQKMDLRNVQGAVETRIANAGGVPAIIAGFAEGLDAATYSNYAQARRRFTDGTMRTLWRNVCGSFATIVPPPSGSQLWYDDRDIAFLQEDAKDAIEVEEGQARTIKALIDAGFKPDDVVDAVMANDLSRLKGSHTGMTSVQLLPPGAKNENGNGAKPAEAPVT
jgi:hypothetical protein